MVLLRPPTGISVEGDLPNRCTSAVPQLSWLLTSSSASWECLTSPTEVASRWTMRSCGIATMLCPLISMIRWPTRTPPRSPIPPRRRLQICATTTDRRQLQPVTSFILSHRLQPMQHTCNKPWSLWKSFLLLWQADRPQAALWGPSSSGLESWQLASGQKLA